MNVQAQKTIQDIEYDKVPRLPQNFNGVGRLKFLQACQIVGVPLDRIPWRDEELVLPVQSVLAAIVHPPLIFTLPVFRFMIDDYRSWRARANRAWSEFCDKEYGPYIKRCVRLQRRLTEPMVNMRFNGAKRSDAIPETLRYELAARRYGLDEAWSSLQERAGNYSEDRVRLLISELLSSLGLPRSSESGARAQDRR